MYKVFDFCAAPLQARVRRDAGLGQAWANRRGFFKTDIELIKHGLLIIGHIFCQPGR